MTQKLYKEDKRRGTACMDVHMNSTDMIVSQAETTENDSVGELLSPSVYDADLFD